MGITEIKDYAYPNARIRAMKSHLLDRKDFERACRIDSLSSFVGFLEDNGYVNLLDIKETEYTQNLIEENLLMHLIDNSKKIYELSHKRARNFMYERIMRHEINAIKWIINSKPQDRYSFRIALSDELKDMFSKLKDSVDIENIVDAFNGTRYETILNDALERYKKTNLIFTINIALDKYHFEKLFESMRTLNSNDRRIAAEIIGIEVDTINIMTVLRTRGMKNAEDYIIPHYHHLNNDILMDCMKSRDVDGIVERLSETAYSDVMKRGFNEYKKINSLFAFEKALKENFILFNKILLTRRIFMISTLLTFLNLKENEIENLRKIAVGINNQLTEKEIEDIIIY